MWICKKLKKKPVKIPGSVAEKLSLVKYLVLAVIVFACYFEVYEKMRGSSPWDVFSMLHEGNFSLEGYLPGVIILLAIIAGMCIQERFFCRFLCPMGAVFSLLPVLPFFTLHRDRASCIKGCKACSNTCPAGIGLPEDGSLQVTGECFQCQKCVDVCPKNHIHCGIKRIYGSEVLFVLIRTGILLGICIALKL